MTRLFLLLASLDAALFLATLQLVSLVNHDYGSGLTLAPYQSALLTGAFLLITSAAGVYNSDAAQDVRTIFKRFALAAQLAAVAAVAWLMLSRTSAGQPFGWMLAGMALSVIAFMLVLLAVHVILVWWLEPPFMKRRIMVFGDGGAAQAVAEFVNGPGRSHFRCVETISSRALQPPGLYVGALALKSPEQAPTPLASVAERLRADEIVVAVDDKRGLPVAELLECRLKGVQVVDALTFWERETGRIDPAQAGAGWLTFSDGFALDPGRRLVKRALDLAIALAFLVAVLPLALAVALLIKLESSGPVFYRQERVGLDGRIFKVWKFRSMRCDAEGDGVPRWAGAADDRVTRLGRFIRKVRIDEIPQVLNVLVGEMSFIGPRPERPFFVEQLRQQIPHYDLRHRIRPGITGWAQVNYPYGASIEDARRKLAYDLYYLKKNGLLLDLAILVQTVRVVLFAQGGR